MKAVAIDHTRPYMILKNDGYREGDTVKLIEFAEGRACLLYTSRWHMGAFDNAVKGGSYDMNYAFAQSRLAAMLHIADMMATQDVYKRQELGRRPFSRQPQCVLAFRFVLGKLGTGN